VGWFLVLIKKSANNIYLKLLKFPKIETITNYFAKIKLFQIKNTKFPPLIFNVAIGQKAFLDVCETKIWTPKM
jgi:hypothetical protein